VTAGFLQETSDSGDLERPESRPVDLIRAVFPVEL
jgi:hypothetical protein